MRELRVPLGLDTSGALVRAAEADRLTPYACPSCQAVLVLRAGTKRIKHFSHSPNGVCSPESILHKTAKLLIANVISANAAGTPAGEIVLDRTCDSCRATYHHTLPLKTFTAAAQEVRVGKFICDVVGYREKGVHALSIEILHTHSVNGEKLEALQGYWIELDAEAVIQNPNRWQAVQAKLKPHRCERCRSVPKKPLVQMTFESPLKKFIEAASRSSAPAKVRDPHAEAYWQRVQELRQRLNARTRRRL
jgi:hypothetical protein